MAGSLPAGSDPWRVTPEERRKHEEQFIQLKPVNGFITGEQAKGFLLQSQLPPVVLGQIWSLADMNADGKMDTNEFSVAMKLIQMKLKGFEVPKVLPPSLKMMTVPPPMGMMGGGMGMPPTTMPPTGISPPVGAGIPQAAMPPVGVRHLNAGMMGGPSAPVGAMPAHAFPQSQFGPMTNGSSAMMSQGVMGGGAPIYPGVATMGAGYARSASPVDIKSQRSGSVTSQDSPTGSVGSPLQEWAVPHPAKLKYTQVFNTNDRTRTGYLTGPQARNILMQSGLPQNILAQIWSLSDIDNDGKLTSEEFCVAMHLADSVRAGDKLPTALPPELIPPSYRRVRSSSIQGGVPVQGMSPPLAMGADVMLGFDAKEDEKNKLMMMATFEDRRKENFEKGQAELEKRRQALLESQRREQEERERKDREEQERRERIRQEQERRRQMELEKQLAKQREVEQEKEEQRRKQMEQREAARREMERQRQLEWEKQRRQELMQQRQKEQERLLQLKAKNQSLNIDLEQLNEKVKDLNSKLSDARNGVNNLKGSIDQMRSTRDTKLAEMESLKNQTKNNSQKLYLLSQERTLLQNQMKGGLSGNPTVESFNIVMQSFNNKHITLNQLTEKLANLERETSQKLLDIDNNNTQLTDLKTQMENLVNEGEKSFDIYTTKRQEVMELRKQKGLSMAPSRPPQPTADATANNGSAWGGEPTWTNAPSEENAWGSEDNWASKAAAAPEWGAQPTAAWGENPEAAEEWAATDQPPADWGAPNDDAWPNTDTVAGEESWGVTDEVPAEHDKPGSVDLTGRMIKYRALYGFEAGNPDELSIEPGDIIAVPEGLAHEPGWLGGELRGKTGWFPEAYVEIMAAEDDVSSRDGEAQETSPTSIAGLQETVHIVGTDMKMTLTGIQETPENASENGAVVEAVATQDIQGSAFMHVPKSNAVGTASPVPGQGTSVEGLQAQALFPWRAKKENHLTFNKGDVITVREQQDMWWYGELEDKAGWFPKSYVKLIAGPRKGGEGLPNVDEMSEGDGTLEAVTPVTEYFEAVYAYLSNETGDLSFNQGDIIMVTKKDGDWWTGIIGDRVGVFPCNYVKETENQVKGSKKPDIAMVIAPYAATGPEQLNLQRGQLIQIRKKSANGWWEGELQAKGKKRQLGWFPASYVKQLSSSARNTPEPGQNQEQVIAMYPYEAQNEDELTFHKGATITLLSKDDGAWWKGECNGSVGLFPANYVQPDKQALAAQ